MSLIPNEKVYLKALELAVGNDDELKKKFIAEAKVLLESPDPKLGNSFLHGITNPTGSN